MTMMMDGAMNRYATERRHHQHNLTSITVRWPVIQHNSSQCVRSTWNGIIGIRFHWHRIIRWKETRINIQFFRDFLFHDKRQSVNGICRRTKRSVVIHAWFDSSFFAVSKRADLFIKISLKPKQTNLAKNTMRYDKRYFFRTFNSPKTKGVW